MTKKHVKLSNGVGADADLIKAVTLADDTFRVFLKNEAGETLCSMRCDNMDAALTEIASANQQMSW